MLKVVTYATICRLVVSMNATVSPRRVYGQVQRISEKLSQPSRMTGFFVSATHLFSVGAEWKGLRTKSVLIGSIRVEEMQSD